MGAKASAVAPQEAYRPSSSSTAAAAAGDAAPSPPSSDQPRQSTPTSESTSTQRGVTFASAGDQVFHRSLSEDSAGKAPAASSGDSPAKTGNSSNASSVASSSNNFLDVVTGGGAASETTPFLLKRSSPRKPSSSDRRMRGIQRLASMPGDVELTDYVDGLARDPDKFVNPHNADTGETILHLLAKEGKVEILRNLLEDSRVEDRLTMAILKQDKLGWNPIMASVKADTGMEDIVELFLTFLESRIEQEQLSLLFDAENISKDTVFTLLMRNSDIFSNCREILFRILTRCSRDSKEVHSRILLMINQLTTPNSCELTSRTMKEVIELSGKFGIDFSELFSLKDVDGNNLLMDLAKSMKDDALREVLTNHRTANCVTHSVLVSKNLVGQTLLTLIEVNREALSESLPLVLKREYGCHRRDMMRTEICLSEQLETSASASEIIQELHQLEPKGWCQKFVIWATLFFTSLTPNIALAFGDIFSDAYLVIEYAGDMKNATHVRMQRDECLRLREEEPFPLQAYAVCLGSRSQFYYTITFLLIPLIFYTTEFLTLKPQYEPTGLRDKLSRLWSETRKGGLGVAKYLSNAVWLAVYFAATVVALILWQPVTACCKFYRDARYESSEGITKVQRRKEKRYVDLAASRGELIEVSIEAVFEPMVQGYIIFPSIISIIGRLANSITVTADGTVKIDFALKSIETAQIISIGASIVSLAWCFSEYNSVRKNMLLDITVSPCSRVLMCFQMLFQVIARLLAFMLFTLFWGPGNFYPLMIFIGFHMVIAAGLHIVFSEDVIYFKKGRYLKFFHNVMLNSFASIYFHNYLRFDEMPVTKRVGEGSESVALKRSNSSSKTLKVTTQENAQIEIGADTDRRTEEEVEFIDAQRPGLHISTFLRQLMFDTLYALEYVVLLAFGFNSKVKDLIDQERRPIIVSVILVLSFLALGLKLVYYLVLHVWSKVILSGKKLIRRDFNDGDEKAAAAVANTSAAGHQSLLPVGKGEDLHSGFFKYVFISRNTWILGQLKHIETTLIVLPKQIIEAIKGRGQDLEYNFTDVTRQVDRSWFSSPKEFLSKLKLNNLLLSLLFFPLVLLVIAINLVIIALLLVGLVLTIPVAVLIFVYNLKSGFRAVELDDAADPESGATSASGAGGGTATLELPPEIDRGETSIFNSDPSRTLASFQRDLEENNGRIDLHRKVDYGADEFEVFSMVLLSLNRKRFPLRTLILDNCDLTDEKLIKLSPLIVKFEKVTLNGSQKMTALGWEKLGNTICNVQSHSKLRKLELKITKNDDDVMRFRREVLLEELKGPTMTSDALAKIGAFIPRLEKVYMDDLFADSNIMLDIIKLRSDNIIEAWKEVAQNIVSCPIAKRKLRCLSIAGCMINDEILGILAPALVRVKMVHLGRNPVTHVGWQTFKNCYVDAHSVHEAALTHLSLNALTETGGSTNARWLLHSAGMDALSPMLASLEEVDLSGQCEVGADGWTALCNGFKMAGEKQGGVNLKALVLGGCKVRGESRNMIEDSVSRWGGDGQACRVEFGPQGSSDDEKDRTCFCC